MYTFDEETGEWVDTGEVSGGENADTGLITYDPSLIHNDTEVTEITNPALPGQEGYGWRYFSDGTVMSPTGQYYKGTDTGAPTLIYDPNKMTGSDLLSKVFSGTVSAKDFTNYLTNNPKQVAGIVGGLAGALGNFTPNVQKVGYQGGIPQMAATRAAVPYQVDPNRRPGSGGRQYFTDVDFTPKSDAAAVAAAKTVAEEKAKAIAAQPAQAMAHGGIAALARGRYLQGSTDGMADKLPASIDDKEPAKLSHGEFVVPADVVSHLGNGNSDAGAKKLYQMMDKIRMARTGSKKQGKQINPDKFMPGGVVGYASGGGIKGYEAGGAIDTTIKPTYESNLSNWAGPYVANMLGKGQALSEMPYQAYQGPLTAGASGLQQQAFGQAAGLTVPAAVGQAAATAGDIAGKMQGLGYQPTQFTSAYQAPGAYQTGQFTSAYNAPGITEATKFTNQYQAPGAYKAGDFTTGMFDTAEAQRYMNPYLQSALDPQLAEARRQAQISNQANLAKLTQAGAYGGGRQAIMQSEADRNLATQLANITGQGYNTAYQQAMAQFNADQARQQQAQQMAEQSRQFGYGQQANAAQLAAQYGLSAQQAQEMARQFNQGQTMTAAQLQAQYGLSAQQAQEASRQFGYGQQANAAQLAAQYGQQAQQAQEASRQFGAQYGLQGLQAALNAAQAQGALGAQQNQLGLANLAQLANLGAAQRGIEAEGLAADKAQFEEARDYPYKMVQYQQSLLSGLPLATQGTTTSQANALQAAASGATTLQKLLTALGIQ